MGVGERRERQREGLREEILAAARTLFVKHGYESVSIRKIASKIEYSPGTIYLYFKDKLAILERICEETFAGLDRKLEAVKNDPSPPLDRLRRGMRIYIQFGLDNPHHYVLTFGTGLATVKREKGERSAIAEAGLRCFSNLRESVQECVDADCLVCEDADEVAQALWAGMHGVTSLLINCQGFPFIEENRLIDRVLTTLIAGVRRQ